MNSTAKTSDDLELQQRLTKRIKILEIEKSLADRRGFWKGLATGLLVVVLLLAGFGIFIWQNPTAVVEFVAGHFLMGYAENLFAGFPDAYMTYNRDRVLQVLDDFTNAMASQRVSREDFRDIFRQFLGALQDQRLTYQELEALLQRLKQASGPAE